jgi:rubredoxin
MVIVQSMGYHGRTSTVQNAHIPSNERIIMKYVCQVCGYTYDSEVGDIELGIDPGTAWEDIPDDFICPICGVGKDQFEAE